MQPAKNSRDRRPELADPLTERELEILGLVADGRSDRDIAQHLFLSTETIKWYNKRVYGKLLVKNRTQAVKRARELGLLEAAAVPAAEGAGPRHNLPAATTPFVGRESERAELAILLADRHTRLVTILGAGGMGKTRLALEAAKSQLPNFRNGVYFTPLVQLRAADQIIPTIAASLKVQLSDAADPAAQLQAYLRDKAVLLLLDNFEHLLEGAGTITGLLEAAPHTKVLATSRERLGLRGETVYMLGGMALPEGETRAEILKCSAVQLFIQGVQMKRANAIRPEDELRYVQRICLQVGGMPLGIELAASLADLLSPKEIAEEIAQNADILATEMRDMPHRLRSVRAVFEYSWSRLTEAERAVYMRLAVFRAGFTREAARAVAGANLRVLKSLAHKSLLQRDSDRERYTLHELLRQYAEEQLKASEAAFAAHQAHLAYYADLMAQCEAGIKGHEQVDALNRIEAEFDNIQAAWQWAVDHSDFDALDRSLEAVYWFCKMRARVPTGEHLFRLARDRAGISFEPGAHPVRRRLLLRFEKSGEAYRAQVERMVALVREHGNQSEAAFFLWVLGVSRYVARDFEGAITVLEEVSGLFQDLGEDFYRIESVHLLGVCTRFLGRMEEVRAHGKQVRELSRRTDNKYALARTLGSEGIYAVFAEDTPRARKDLQEAIAIRTELGDHAGLATSLVGLSFDAFFRGDFPSARSFAEDSLTRATDTNSLFPRAIALGMLGWLAAVEGAYDEAWNLCRESLSLALDPNVAAIAQQGLAMAACGLEDYAAVGEHLALFFNSHSPLHTARGFMSFLLVLGILYASRGEAERAVEVLALAFTHPKSPTAWMEQWGLLELWQTRLKAALGTEQYEAAWERGAKMELASVKYEFSRP